MFKWISGLAQFKSVITRAVYANWIAAESILILSITAYASPTIANSYQSNETSIDYTIFRLASDHNDASAQYLVGRNYLKGKSVKQDINKAIKWFERAAKQNHAKAQYQLGKMYLYGEHVKQDRQQAFIYLNRAAENNELDAQYELANYYLQGNPGEKEYKEAVKWLRRAVARDHVRAHYELGKLIYEGKGIQANPREAIELLTLAADNGLLDASQYLNQVKESNPDITNVANNDKPVTTSSSPVSSSSAPPRSDKTKPKTTPKNVKARPSANEYYRMGLAALTADGNKRQVGKAAEYFQKAAQENHGKAQYQLAKLYQQGIGVEQDQDLHRQWLEKAAHAGVLSAQRDLRILNGTIATPAPSQPKSARTLTLKEQAHATPNELYALGLNYLTGNEVVKDPIKASELFMQAAKLDHPRSQYQLGLMYIDGIGLQRDTDEAKQWLSKAASAGIVDARDVLNNLTPKQVKKEETTTVAIVIDTLSEPAEPDANVTLTSQQELLKQQTIRPTRTRQESTPQQPQLSSLEQQASSGDSAAQYTLGLNYLHGRNNFAQDTQQALQWLTKAADNQVTEAQIELGNLYFNGTEVERDYEQAAYWLEFAAGSGDPDAQYLLGRLFQKGWGVARDKSVAIMWYRRAANQGHREARKRLGGCRIC
ncbi:SEL1-like repeat protein [Kaarinaea lacus]